MNHGPTPLQLLSGMPGADALIDGQSFSRADLARRVRDTAGRLAEEGLAFKRLVWLPTASSDAIVLQLALLEIGASLNLVPLRASKMQAQELELAARAFARITGDARSFQIQFGDTAASASLGATLAVASSGSTGPARWIELGFHALCRAAGTVAARLAARQGDRWLLSLPLDHISGQSILIRALVSAGTLVIPGKRPLLEGLAVVQHASLVSAQLHDLIDCGFQAAPALKSLLLGGGPVSPELLKRARHLPVYLSYGSTESAAACVIDKLSECPSEGSGRPLAGVSLKHFTNESWSLSRDGGAEVNLDDRLEWLPGGRLHVIGRRGRLLISGGEKLQAERLEKLVLRHVPGLRAAMVLARQDRRLGDRPVLLLEMQTGFSMPQLKELRELLQQKIESIWLPVELHELPASRDTAIKHSLSALAAHLGLSAGQGVRDD